MRNKDRGVEYFINIIEQMHIQAQNLEVQVTMHAYIQGLYSGTMYSFKQKPVFYTNIYTKIIKAFAKILLS